MTLKRKFAASSAWLMAGAIAGQLSGFVVFVMLARLLSPAEFGVVAFASIFIDLSKQFLSAGIPDALIRHPEWDDGMACTAFWINVGMALMVVLLCIGIGVPLLVHLDHAEIGLVFAVLSATLLLDAMRIVFDARLRRDFNFKLLTSREVTTQAIAGVLGVGCAVAGAGVWALVAQRVAASVLGTAATWWLVRWQPRWVFSRDHAGYLLRFASRLVGGQMFATLTSHVGPIVIALSLGPTALAFFRAGTRLLTTLTQITIAPLQSAALSAFSRIQNVEDMQAVYLRLTGACALLACPVFIGAGAISTDLVVLLLGPTWREAGAIMSASALVVGASVPSYFFAPALTAAGNTRYSFRYYLLAAVGNAVFAVLAAPFGAAAVALSQTMRAYAMVPMTFVYLQRVIGLSPRAAVGTMAAPFLCSLAMGFAMVAAGHFWWSHLSPLLRILLVSALGAAVYLLLMVTMGRPALRRGLHELKPFAPGFIRARW